MDKTGNLNDKQGYKEAILARRFKTTGIGDVLLYLMVRQSCKNASWQQL